MSMTTSSASGSRRSMENGASLEVALCAAQARDARTGGRTSEDEETGAVDMAELLAKRGESVGGGRIAHRRLGDERAHTSGFLGRARAEEALELTAEL